MNVEFSEDLSSIQQVGVVHDPNARLAKMKCSTRLEDTYFLAFHATRGKLRTRAIQYPLMRNKKVKNP